MDSSTAYIGKKCHWADRVDSTNELAHQLVAKGAGHGTVVLAEYQTNGHGRLGRKWFSPRGGLWFSVLLRAELEPNYVPRVTLVIGLAVVRAIRRIYELPTHLKWPNDVLINGKKVCGILTELDKGTGMSCIIGGIGINANVSIARFPTHLRERATSLRDLLGHDISKARLLRAILGELDALYREFVRNPIDIGDIIKEWTKFSDTIGKAVRIIDGDESFEGTAVGLSPEGELIVEVGDKQRKIVAGDCVYSA